MRDGDATIPSDWSGEYCRFSVCWPSSEQWLAVLRNVLVLPSTGRYWNGDTGSILETQAIIKQTFNNNLHLKEVLMACGDAELSEIAAAIRLLASSSCCNGGTPANGGVQVFVDLPGGGTAPLYGSVPPAALPQGGVPPDYPGTEAEYLNDECRTAYQMVRNFIDTIRGLSYVNFASTNGLGLVIASTVVGLIVLPEFLIPILIAALIVNVLVGQGLRDLADYIEGDIDNWVCQIVTNSSATGISIVLNSLLDIAITAINVTSVVGVALKTVALILFNTDTLNVFFTMTQGFGPEEDCSACFGEAWEYNNGTVWLPMPYDPQTGIYTGISRATGAKWRGDWRITGACQTVLSITRINFTDDPLATGDSAYATCDAPTVFIELPKPWGVGDLGPEVAYLAPWSTTQFTIEFTSQDVA